MVLVQVTKTLWINPDNVESIRQPWDGAPVTMRMKSGEVFNFQEITDMQSVVDAVTGRLAGG